MYLSPQVDVDLCPPEGRALFVHGRKYRGSEKQLIPLRQAGCQKEAENTGRKHPGCYTSNSVSVTSAANLVYKGALPTSPLSMLDKWVCLLDSDYGSSEYSMVCSNISIPITDSDGREGQESIWASHLPHTLQRLWNNSWWIKQTADRHHFTRLDTIRILTKSKVIPETRGYLLR